MKEIWNKYSIVFWIFLIGSFLGFAHENILMFVRGRYALRQGLIYEPLIPVYGLGALVFYLVYKNTQIKTENIILQVLAVFIIGFLVGGAVEYVCSFVQEKVFGTTSWNYSSHKFNLNGRISFKYSCFWGLIGVFYYYLIMPVFLKIDSWLKYSWVKFLTVIASVILIFDCTISSLACYRQAQRRNGIEASSRFDHYLDKRYDDEFLNGIYNNAKAK